MFVLHRPDRGFTLVEMLVVLSIVAVLAMAGVYMIRPRTRDSVRSVMTELEGQLINAENASLLSAQDVYVVSSGNWTDGTFILDARPFVGGGLVPADPSTLPAALVPGGSTYRLGSAAECFRSRYNQGNRDHMSAGVDCSGAGWYATALGTAPDLATLSTFSPATMSAFKTAIGTPLVGQTYVVLSGMTQTFLTGFCIVVVGLNGGKPIPNGPIGMIVVPASSSNIYKYYKQDGSTTWKRL